MNEGQLLRILSESQRVGDLLEQILNLLHNRV